MRSRNESHQQRVDRETILIVSLRMNTYPANEWWISEVERGRSCEAVLPSPPGKTLCVGDTVLFALSDSRSGQLPNFIKGGDSVLVSHKIANTRRSFSIRGSLSSTVLPPSAR